jgi:outer membrane immunogenic protein
MRKTLATILAVAFGSAPALAADIVRRPPPQPYSAPAAVPLPLYNWSGFYVGGNLGYQWGEATNLGADPNGFSGGVQAGYNWQTGQFVFGGESDIQVSAATDRFAAYKFSNPWFGTVRARAGFAADNVLVYATGGFAYGGGRLEFAGATESQTHTGWTAGGGVEVALTPNWSARAEYLYVRLGSETYSLSGLSHGIDSNIVRMGVNYRF